MTAPVQVKDRGKEAWRLAAAVPDPELAVVSIGDLGILREVEVDDDGAVRVTVTPTYSGCPAMDAIGAALQATLREAGFGAVTVRTVLAPAWTTDWISSGGRAALLAAGIAPPHPAGPVAVALRTRCPQCGSLDTAELNHFGSTACKALWRCGSCAEPFDAVKAF